MKAEFKSSFSEPVHLGSPQRCRMREIAVLLENKSGLLCTYEDINAQLFGQEGEKSLSPHAIKSHLYYASQRGYLDGGRVLSVWGFGFVHLRPAVEVSKLSQIGISVYKDQEESLTNGRREIAGLSLLLSGEIAASRHFKGSKVVQAMDAMEEVARPFRGKTMKPLLFGEGRRILAYLANSNGPCTKRELMFEGLGRARVIEADWSALRAQIFSIRSKIEPFHLTISGFRPQREGGEAYGTYLLCDL